MAKAAENRPVIHARVHRVPRADVHDREEQEERSRPDSSCASTVRAAASYAPPGGEVAAGQSQARSSIGRALVSKTSGCRFESGRACHSSPTSSHEGTTDTVIARIRRYHRGVVLRAEEGHLAHARAGPQPDRAGLRHQRGLRRLHRFFDFAVDQQVLRLHHVKRPDDRLPRPPDRRQRSPRSAGTSSTPTRATRRRSRPTSSTASSRWAWRTRSSRSSCPRRTRSRSAAASA